MTELAQATGSVIGTVQTDTFCDACGYNLHAQPVIRDDRLQIPICRCPECGRYAAAGQTLTATRVWLNRLATSLLASWVLFLLVFFGVCALFLGMLAYWHTMEMTEYAQPMGRGYYAPYRGYYGGYHYELRKPSLDPEVEIGRWWHQFWYATSAILLAVMTGCLFSAFAWHCKGVCRLAAFLPPLLGCFFATLAWQSNTMTIPIRPWGLLQIGYYLGIQLASVGFGLLIGRPLARVIVRIFVPPKARQHLAFLWATDGKRPTPAA